MPTNDELRLLNNRFSGDRNHQIVQKQQSHPLTQNTTNASPLVVQQQNLRKSFQTSQNSPFQKVYPSSSTPPLNLSDTSNTSNEGSIGAERQRPMVFRPRSRSLSSPSRSPIGDNNMATMNHLFKERFPKAQAQMDERLTSFINEYKNSTSANRNRDSQPIVRFVTNQVVEIARDCLHKSHSKQLLTSRYFCEMSENLQRLLVETNEKSPEAATAEIARIIKKLILIISRPARLLECLEFDPAEFYKLLEAAEDQAKSQIASDLPIYIITKLGLNRDPLSDLQQNNSDEVKDEKCLSKCDIDPNIINLNERFVVSNLLLSFVD